VNHLRLGAATLAQAMGKLKVQQSSCWDHFREIASRDSGTKLIFEAA